MLATLSTRAFLSTNSPNGEDGPKEQGHPLESRPSTSLVALYSDATNAPRGAGWPIFYPQPTMVAPACKNLPLTGHLAFRKPLILRRSAHQFRRICGRGRADVYA